MQTQNYSNHTRLVLPYHLLTGVAIGFLFVQSLIHLIRDPRYELSHDVMWVVLALILVSFFVYTRQFALRAQDRAIRAEEGLRHFILTGKPLHKGLTTVQIIALRFASDEEFAGLAKRAAEESLSSKEIKRSIRSWKADHWRA